VKTLGVHTSIGGSTISICSCSVSLPPSCVVTDLIMDRASFLEGRGAFSALIFRIYLSVTTRVHSSVEIISLIAYDTIWS
jgi:hypothetical protein